MAELITEDCPRIKFCTSFVRPFTPTHGLDELERLAALMHRMEEEGAAPVLNDGKVGGNCAISPSVLAQHGEEASSSSSTLGGGLGGDSGDVGSGLCVVSMSGKPPGHVLQPQTDFVLVTGFDRASWAVEYRSGGPEVRPSSDSPLLYAALVCGKEYGWEALPRVVLHGHALAEGEGLAHAAQLGLPISEHATLFSTPEDLAELEDLFRLHHYPACRCFIRRGHGFFLLADSVEEAAQLYEQLVEPFLLRKVA